MRKALLVGCALVAAGLGAQRAEAASDVIAAAPIGAHAPGFGAFDTGTGAYGQYNVNRGPADGGAPTIASSALQSFAQHAKRAGAARGPLADPGPEVPKFRTAMSKTFVTSRGYLTRIYGAPVNVKQPDGGFLPVDNTIVATSAGFTNRRGVYGLDAPRRATDGPVTYRYGASRLTTQLLGARATKGQAANDAVTYRDVLPGASLTYEATSSGPKEDVTFATRAAAVPLTFRLTVPRGNTPTLERGGAVRITSPSGAVVTETAPPFLVDAAGSPDHGAVHSTLVRRGQAWLLRRTPSRKWLAQQGRKFPVTLDPYNTVPTTSCQITGGGSANTSYCGTPPTSLSTGTSQPSRVLMRVDMSAIPADAIVNEANVGLSFDSNKNTEYGRTTFTIAPVTKPWSSTTATWNRYDSTHTWATPGGDQGSTVGTIDSSIGADGNVTTYAQAILNGTAPNYGLEVSLAPTDHPQTLYLDTSSPGPIFTQVRWSTRTGDAKGMTFDRTQLTDRSQMGVNVANGNLLVHGTDLDIAGIGLDQILDDTYNSGAYLYAHADPYEPPTGDSDSYLSTGPTAERIEPTVEDHYSPSNDVRVTYVDRTGARYPFDAVGGSYIPQNSLDAALCKGNAAPCNVPSSIPNGYKLLFRDGQIKYFSNADGSNGRNGYLDAITDGNGNKLSITRDSSTGRPTQLVDTHGRTISLESYYDGSVSAATDNAGGRSIKPFGPDANGKQFKFEYNAIRLLTKITDPAGRVTTIAYDDAGRVSSVTHVTDTAHGTGDTTTYQYVAPYTDFYYLTGGCPDPHASDSATGHAYGQTIVTDPKGGHTIYCYDTADRVYAAYDQNGHKRTNTYDKDDNVREFINDAGRKSTNNYDKCCRPMGVLSPSSNGTNTAAQTQLGYDKTDASGCATGQLGVHPFDPSSSTDASGQKTTFAYDSANNPTSAVQGPNAPGVTVHHDPANHGLVDYTKDGDGHQTNYQYYASGDLKEVDRPAPLGALKYTYDAVSRVKTATDGNGRTTTYTYDNDDRVTNAAYSDGTSTAYSYDDDGNLIKQTDSNGTITNTYDQKNRRRAPRRRAPRRTHTTPTTTC